MTISRETLGSVTAPLDLPSPRVVARWNLLAAGSEHVLATTLPGVETEGSVLAVVAHPGDEVLAMGGALAAMAAAGTAVHVLCLTPGSTAAAAPASFPAAVESLGVQSSRVDDLESGALMQHTWEIERAIHDALAVLRPGAVLTLWSGDPHSDHAELGRVAVALGAEAGVPVHQFVLNAVLVSDPVDVPGVLPLSLDSSARRAREAALTAYAGLAEVWSDEAVIPGSADA